MDDNEEARKLRADVSEAIDLGNAMLNLMLGVVDYLKTDPSFNGEKFNEAMNRRIGPTIELLKRKLQNKEVELIANEALKNVRGPKH